jgi:hypothetical protein
MQKMAATLICAAVVAVAATPVATVTAPSTIVVQGSSIPGSAAASVPVYHGDLVRTTDSPAFLRFDGRAVFTLHEETVVQVIQNGRQATVCLLRGSYHYKFEPKSDVTVCRDNTPLATLLEGDVTMGNAKRIPVIVASGGGAALLAGVVKQKSKDCPTPDGAGQAHGNTHDCRVIK